MDKLYEAISALLNLIATFEVDLEKTPQGTGLPYIDYVIEILSTSFDRMECFLIIEVWYDGEHTLELEQEVELIRKGLDNYTEANANVGFDLSLESLLPIISTNQDNRMRSIRFSMNAYIA